MLFQTSLLLAFSSLVAAKSCMNITIPITITARNAVFNNYKIPETPLDSTEFAINLTRYNHNATAEALTGYATISGTYNISAQLCTPQSASNGVLQLLTHGIGFDKTYWDVAYNNFQYSYVDKALSDGFSTFSFDRLGIGLSSHGDPRNEIQSFLEIEALAELTRKLRAGTIPDCKAKFSKVVHVGHSFGSVQSYSLGLLYPELSDGLVLTGFSLNSTFAAYFGAGADFVTARTNQPYRLGSAADAAAISSILASKPDEATIEQYGLTDYFAQPLLGTKPLDYVLGYLTNRDVNALVFLFLLGPYYDPGIAYFGEMGKQPVTIGELLTLGSISEPNLFPGPVLVFTGSDDLPFCGHNCFVPSGSYPNIPAAVAEAFPKASTFESYIQPNTGHGLTFHYNATAGYKYINDWLKAHDLGA